MYKNQLPSKPADSGAFTWIVSTEVPRQSEVTAQQLPLARQLRSLENLEFNDEQRRTIYGQLIYTVTNATSNNNLTNLVPLEIGRPLSEFDVTLIDKEVANVPDNVELQHNNNLFDFESVGLTDEEIIDLENKSRSKFNSIRIELVNTNSQLKTVQNSIASYNKALTQVNDAIVALELLGNEDALMNKFTAKQLSIKQTLEVLTLQEQELALALSILYDDMAKLGLMVR